MESDPFIVVSDIHLGTKESSVNAFSNFCGWLARLENAKSEADSDGEPIIGKPNYEQPEPRKIKAPNTLILLGDILELWAPQAITAPLRDGLTIFNKLLALSCTKVYVLGNHDEGLSDYCSHEKMEDGHKSPTGTQQDYKCANGSRLIIVNGHYPDLRQYDRHDWRYAKERNLVANKEVVQVDQRDYIFLHGHQFDKMFRSVGPLRRIPGLMKGIADKENSIHKGTGPVSLVAVVILVAIGVTNWMNALAVIGQLLWGVTFILGILGFSWAWATLQKPAWTYLFKYLADRPKCSSIGRIIDKEYYDCTLDKTSDKSIIVFGHTHVPDSKIVPKQSMPKYGKKCPTASRTKTFVNCGAWVDPEKQELATNALLTKFLNAFNPPKKQGQGDTVPFNTFVYIDQKGPPLLLQWNDDDDKDKQYVNYFKLPEESRAC